MLTALWFSTILTIPWFHRGSDVRVQYRQCLNALKATNLQFKKQNKTEAYANAARKIENGTT